MSYKFNPTDDLHRRVTIQETYGDDLSLYMPLYKGQRDLARVMCQPAWVRRGGDLR